MAIQTGSGVGAARMTTCTTGYG